MDTLNTISKQVEKVFRDMWPRINNRRDLVNFAEEYTDMREIETINFLAIYLLGFTREASNQEKAWSQASVVLDKILTGEVSH